jgi:hypothetical protein
MHEEKNDERKVQSEEPKEIESEAIREQPRFKEQENYKNTFSLDEEMCLDLLKKYNFLDFGCNRSPAKTTVFLELKNHLK